MFNVINLFCRPALFKCMQLTFHPPQNTIGIELKVDPIRILSLTSKRSLTRVSSRSQQDKCSRNYTKVKTMASVFISQIKHYGI